MNKICSIMSTLLLISVFIVSLTIILDGILLPLPYPKFTTLLIIFVTIKTIYIILATAVVSAYFDRNTNKEVKL